MKVSKKSKKRRIILILVLILAIFLILFGARVYLYVHALLGNDLVIKITADKENLFLKHEDSDSVKIRMYAITNLFCNTNCVSEFIDLSANKTLESAFFNLKLPRTKEYILTAENQGTGQKLYRFDIECKSKRTYLCETMEEPKKRSLLITLNYEPNENEKEIKQELKYQLDNLAGKMNYFELNLNEFQLAIEKLNKTCETDFNLNNARTKISDSEEIYKTLTSVWEDEDYFLLKNEFPKLNASFSEAEAEFNNLNLSLSSNLSVYNSLIDNLLIIRSNLISFQSFNLSDNSFSELKGLVEKFNNLTLLLLEKNNLSAKKISIDELLNKTEIFSNLTNYETDNNITLNYKSNLTINEINLSKIILKEINFSAFELKEPSLKCCLYEKCNECCNETCYNNKEKYPIIFLHGHSFNKDVSADASLDAFEDIQRELDKDGYLNAGSLLLSSSEENIKGIWGKTNFPITVKASYYFDILTNEGKSVLIQTKTDNLDTYTLRLREIINAVKYKTNREKVILITHSMGGLIARRYLQVFGENDIEKIIIISSPNKGISRRILSYCSLFGTKLECRDMDKDSLFMSKLNNAPAPKIPIINIIGIGCDTDGEDGDGIVANSSQYLDYAENYFINSSCKESEFKYLHAEIVDIKKYPKVYKVIKDSLINKSTSPYIPLA